MARKTSSAVVALAKDKRKAADEGTPIKLSTGRGYAIFRPISTILITDAQATVKDPPVPTFFNEEKGREEENPNHPDYINAVNEAMVKRFFRVIDAVVLFGMTLCDEDGNESGLPEDSSWLKQLKFLEKRGSVDLSEFDLDDDFDLEFLFKRYIAVGNTELTLLTSLSGVTEEEITRAEESFPGDAKRGANSRTKAN